jgi:hypothetical protein
VDCALEASDDCLIAEISGRIDAPTWKAIGEIGGKYPSKLLNRFSCLSASSSVLSVMTLPEPDSF